MRRELTCGMWAMLCILGGAAYAADPTNVAPFGTATQSSDLNAAAYPAGSGIDGNYSNFTHTIGSTADPDPWWQVEFANEFEISQVVLYNRSDCCQLRFRDLTVTVLKGDGTTVYTSALLNPENVLGGPGSVTADIVADAGAAVRGVIVRVQRTGDPDGSGGATSDHDKYVLSLAEVEVLGLALDMPPKIVSQPVGGRVEVGQPFELAVVAIGSEPLRYQWRKNDVDLDGETAAVLGFLAAEKDDSGVYQVVVTNDIDDVVSDPATLEVLAPNIAPRGQAVQSSIGSGGEPARAIDGNTNQAWWGGSVTHTSEIPLDPAPWWELWLPGASTIETITLWNRSDCCWDRLSNFKVAVLNDARAEVFAEEYYTDGLGYVDQTAPFDIELPANTTGRFVRVELLGPNALGATILSLAEVEVHGSGPEAPVDPNANIASEGTATHSSQLGTYSADLALNGSLGDFTHTSSADPNPAWWQVDLGRPEDIGVIVLYNRTSCCGSRLRDITVTIWDTMAAEPAYTSGLLNEENAGYAFPNGPASLTVDLIAETGGPVTGQIVRVERTPDPDYSGGGSATNPDEMNVLSLAEVEIFREATCPPQGDTHCAGLTYEGPMHGRPGEPGVYWVRAAARDDSGDTPYVTISAEDGVNAPVVSGPSRIYGAPFFLKAGAWTLRARADDSTLCPDEAADAECTVALTVAVDPDNVAVGGTATQSSIYNAAGPDRANDGCIDGVFNDGSVIHTDPADVAPWWEVDLGASFALERIVLWNRTDLCIGCIERLSNFRVGVLDADRGEVFAESYFTDGASFCDTTQGGFEIALPAATAGRFVRIDIMGPGTSLETILNLAEVEVLRAGAVPTELFVKMGAVNAGPGVDIADAIALLGYLFAQKTPPLCAKAADANDDDALNIADAITILGYLFSGKPMFAPDHAEIKAANNTCKGYAADGNDGKPFFPAKIGTLNACDTQCTP